ncbi:LOW QUALITY PROTEIN: fumarylacetoacetate hydrolase domain-containing protein 2 [Manduca sexta]|uniref:LOW QUALITY PROTEIN: fumarylacetoacetate hydrolase domain-containing protein 2 n=1 Tax=Manduca sexta TaxID=7130 RepID=UPI0018904205|nr:LOW QUALITY PROTEIN: fumarylacetoacetate hydrolase domain-containing protein 2 [Manduca sexta]
MNCSLSRRLLCRRAITCIKSNLLSEIIPSKGLAVEIARPFSVTQNRNMKLVQFSYKNDPKKICAGYLEGDGIVDINKADPSLGTTVIEILRNNQIDNVKKLKSTTKSPCQCPNVVPMSCSDINLPIHGIDKVMCIGLNYKDHCEEQKLNPPPVPMMFSKFASTIIGPDQAVRLRTDVTRKVDWEVELVVVIGKKASFVKAADAFDYIVGYTVAQDISARDWQKEKNMGQFLLGKSMDTFCPLGPCITTSDEIGDPQSLDIKCSVNGVLKQSSNTNQLIHKIPDVIERLTSVMTLLPGDIILTGTPGGVGMYRDPPEYLQPGDVIRSEIQNIGAFDIKIEKF